ncbi:MAG TPA: hypothetical protein VFX16_22945 [Pseudonocardiaceae bacterium]|nr:hypothetical protein [Pseudonocardiaceae bacterium]
MGKAADTPTGHQRPSHGAVVRNAVVDVLRNGAVTKSATTNNSGNVVIPVTVNVGTSVTFNLKFFGNNTFGPSESIPLTITVIS